MGLFSDREIDGQIGRSPLVIFMVQRKKKLLCTAMADFHFPIPDTVVVDHKWRGASLEAADLQMCV